MPHRTAPGLLATYRVQLRNGVDLAAVRERLDWFRALGVSHIYLSPLFSAAPGSAHGYDVIDPNRVDPVLGGEEAFRELSVAARAAGLGLVLDIVPNHMAFTPHNPHVADIMRHGEESRFARLFDIDWRKGPLHFPVLERTPEELLAKGHLAFKTVGSKPSLRIHDQDYPLRDTPLARALMDGEPLSEDRLGILLNEQFWRVGHWRKTATAIVHRRFFNISSLIGVRQDDPEVFDFTHRWIIEQVRAGRVQGLRVDHVDGLASPGRYLRRLRDVAGVTPIWVEKIVKRDETVPANWPTEGMSGYEIMTGVTQFLTDADGLERLRDAARRHLPRDYAAEVRAVRRQLLATVFVAELDRVTRAALEALASGEMESASVRAAIIQLAMHWPVYRSYAADSLPLGTRFAKALEAARADRLPSSGLGLVFTLLSAPDDPLARAFAARFEQLTGALTAKSEEDTVFFRSVAYLPFCEVGAEPDLDAIDGNQFAQWMMARAETTPCALSALSTHDTKRSADARAALIALSYHGELGARLYAAGSERARARGVDGRWGIYAAQVALMMLGEPERDKRVAEHLAKAMRESKDASSYEAPDLEAERTVIELARALVKDLGSHALWSKAEESAYLRTWHQLILAQLALQLTAPGIPDIYQGTEVVSVTLTDPDNRRPIDWNQLSRPTREIDARKRELTRSLLEARRKQPELFALGSYALKVSAAHWTVRRNWQDREFCFDIERPSSATASEHHATAVA